MTSEAKAAAAPPQHKRHLKNFLLDKSYQLRYTAVIVLISAALTTGLGFLVVSKAQEASRVVETQMKGEDPVIAKPVVEQMRRNDRTIVLAIVGFGVVFCVAMMGYGIVITHKVAGPLFKLSIYLNHIRDGKIGKVYDLRKGDQLHAFFSVFKEMHTALVKRTQDEVAALDKAIASGEKASGDDAKACVEALRAIKKQKEESLG